MSRASPDRVDPSDVPLHPDLKPWGNPHDAATYTGRHYVTVIRALRTGELHGHQRTDRGRWGVHVACVDAWMTGVQDTASRCECNQGRMCPSSNVREFPKR